jgi:hypothetical protein
MTDDGKYFILDPTISPDHGPNCKSKVYNVVRLKYARGPQNELLDYAEAQCVIEIPRIITILKKKKTDDNSDADEINSQDSGADLKGRD